MNVLAQMTRPNIAYKINPQVGGLQPAASIQLAERAKAMAAAGQTIFDLTIGEPDFDTPQRVKDAAVRALSNNNTHYVNGRGLLPLRERIASKLRDENGIACEAGNILVTPGAKAAIYIAVRTLLSEGDEAIVLDPSWVSYESIIHASGGVTRKVELPFEDNHRITAERLESAVTAGSRLLIVNTPNNPTGRMLSEDEAGAIADFALKHDLCVIADEVYEKITFDGLRHISLGALERIADRVITVNGLSKSAAMTGWRVGYLAAHPQLVDRIYMLYQHMATCISGFSQDAALVALDCDDEIEAMRAAYERRRDVFVGALDAIDGVTCRAPGGAFYAWAAFDLPEMSSAEICDFLLKEAQVASVPGEAYGLGGEQCVRFSLATSEEVLEQAAARISAAMRKQQGKED